VPRFYLHVTDGKKTYRDSTGLELANIAVAEAFARIISSDLRMDGQFDSYYVDVRDQQDNEVAKVFVFPRH
jgi:hypothetical protein